MPGEDKSVPPAPQPEAHDGAITLEGAVDLSAGVETSVALMMPADNEHRRRAAARLFAVARPTVATRLQWVEEDAAGFVRLLESGQKTGIADMRRWAKRARFVCHRVFAEPAPPSLDRLIDSRFVWRPRVDDIKRGRPSPAPLQRAEAQRWIEEEPETLPSSLNAFARALLAWFVREHPNIRPSKSVRVVEGYVRKLWRRRVARNLQSRKSF